MAIDFQRLLLDERRRAQQQSSSKPAPAAKPPETAATAADPSFVVENVTAALPPASGYSAFLLAHRMNDAPPSVFYCRDYVTAEQERALLAHIYAAPASRWVTLKARRLQQYGGAPSADGMLAEPLPEFLCAPLAQRLCDDGVLPLPFNHVLINEYAPGEGILPHTDGPLYYPVVAILSLRSGLLLDVYAPARRTATATPASSLSSSSMEQTMPSSSSSSAAPLRTRHFSVYLQPRSLLVFSDDVYRTHLHGIEPRVDDDIDALVVNRAQAALQAGARLERTQARVSLTMRIVPLVKRPRKNP